jgi:hypothetical protein
VCHCFTPSLCPSVGVADANARAQIVCMVWAMQNLVSNSFTGYSTYISFVSMSLFLASLRLLTPSTHSYFLEQAGLAYVKWYEFVLSRSSEVL